MGEPEIQKSILQALGRLSLAQQHKMLQFINAMLTAQHVEKPRYILQFAGIFDDVDTQEFEASLKDCEQIDNSEW